MVAPEMYGRTRSDACFLLHVACHSYELSGPSACLLAYLPPHPSVRSKEQFTTLLLSAMTCAAAATKPANSLPTPD